MPIVSKLRRILAALVALFYLASWLSNPGVRSTTMASVAGAGVLYLGLIKPRGYPFVWYVSVLGGVAGCVLYYVFRAFGSGESLVLPVYHGVANGGLNGLLLALAVYAIRGEVEDPADTELEAEP